MDYKSRLKRVNSPPKCRSPAECQKKPHGHGDEGKGIRREGGKEGLIQKAGTAGGDGGGCHGVNGLVRSFGRDDSSEARERASGAQSAAG